MTKQKPTPKYLNLDKIIRESDYSTKVVANKVGLTYQTLRKRVLGVTEMEFNVLKKLSKLLGESVEYLSK